ncbi:ABC transporter permease [Hymenobacter properus]|uniref:ABC transporter permease n=1 Tax=Hymenobacter properus TaxID=2791026 RepID=A0A931BGW6_9BACT|nr:ABC transporter permease [Hymenobacter properus]MBF9141416.1 ABC transporter permease [Hymenobacter properus]MBR7720225.1 ABC transporter permease [Microvirga sp. SRT04]
MARLLFWRLLRTALAVWALASGVFLLSRLEGSTAVELAQPDPAELRVAGAAATPAARQALDEATRHRLGLDIPLFYVGTHPVAATTADRWHWNGVPNQYHKWLSEVVRGRLGTSFRTGESVGGRLQQALRFTLPLTGTAAALAVVFALLLAQRLAARPGWHRPVRGALVALQALPLFVIALGLLLLFANPATLAWFPSYGLEQAIDADVDEGSRLGSYLWHLALPVAALTLSALPELTLQLTAALEQELGSQYATTARAKGLGERAIISHHALRNALLPSLAQLAELLPALVAGAVVVEVAFALPGMGRLLAEAAAARDFPVLVGSVLLVGTARLLALLITDLLARWADPRIRWQQ